jgi:hypothetical protein
MPSRSRPEQGILDPGRSMAPGHSATEEGRMAEPMDAEARRLIAAFSDGLSRLNPQPLDWQRLYEFILYAFRHAPQAPEAVGHALVQDGLGWDEAERFVLFYTHAMELLERETATRRAPRRRRGPRAAPPPGRRPRGRKGRRANA